MAVSKAMLSKGDSKIAVDAAHSLDGPHNELMAVINEVACEIHGYYVLKSSQDDPFRLFFSSSPHPHPHPQKENCFHSMGGLRILKISSVFHMLYKC